ncbi:hypothetical protein B0H17DRAFT_1153097 [Mycena rosella]|uniref:Uncharacterized protein n=1 Tax=Mycena rosella TaxID=1033263 RepID=A0AAD7FDF7_MYCRO|nr:hypothetical protein B0H17DRAFT_1153097 [Mycena rosella]
MEDKLQIPATIEKNSLLEKLKSNFEDIAQVRASTLQAEHKPFMLTTFRYIKKDPAGFRVGDIVKMGFALVGFRQASRNEDDKQIYDSFAKAAFKAHSTNEAKAPSVGSRPMQVV